MKRCAPMTNSSISLTGKILYLTSSSSLLEQQIQAEASIEELGQNVKDLSFHYGVNTDAMISGKACTFGYTPEILGPYFLENFQEVIHCGDVQQGGFQIIVGGDAYGTGSSREAAAEQRRPRPRGVGLRVRVRGQRKALWGADPPD